jgi:hypothetical protein
VNRQQKINALSQLSANIDVLLIAMAINNTTSKNDLCKNVVESSEKRVEERVKQLIMNIFEFENKF